MLFPVLKEKSFESNQRMKLRNQHDSILITKLKLLITEGDYKCVELKPDIIDRSAKRERRVQHSRMATTLENTELLGVLTLCSLYMHSTECLYSLNMCNFLKLKLVLLLLFTTIFIGARNMT